MDDLLLTDKDYMRLVKYVPIPEHDLRKVAQAQAERTESMLKEQWKQVGIKEVVDNMTLACVNGSTEWQRLKNLRDVLKYYEAKSVATLEDDAEIASFDFT